MARKIKHIHASPNEWIRVHRGSGGVSKGGGTGVWIIILSIIFVLYCIPTIIGWVTNFFGWTANAAESTSQGVQNSFHYFLDNWIVFAATIFGLTILFLVIAYRKPILSAICAVGRGIAELWVIKD
ncbi:MAG TPA: hypothetical protein VMJ32_01250 [Pirellulales bacterium]|nr:hypothetical protein [Pirellulales bacterium]